MREMRCRPAMGLLAAIMAAMGCDGAPSDMNVGVDVDVAAALQEVYAGESTAVQLQEGAGGALLELVEAPQAASSAWKEAYRTALGRNTRQLPGLVFVAGDACIGSSAAELSQLVETLRWPDGGGASQTCPGDALPQDFLLLRMAAVRALGRLAGDHCRDLGGDRTSAKLAESRLVEWVTTGAGGVQIEAAAALLENAPELAARVRSRLPRDRQALLVPIAERRVEPQVEDGPPPVAPSESAQDEYAACDPQAPRPTPAASCDTIDENGAETGDHYVDWVIEVHANYGIGDDCEELAARYNDEIDFEDDEWDDGFGLAYPCDSRRNYARAMNALWLLESAPANPNPPGDYSGGVIGWAYDYVRNVTPEFQASCEGGSMAYTVSGFWCDMWHWCDERIVLQPNFFSLSVPIRAAAILHEARHAAGWDHDGGDDCPREESCDSKYSYRGSNTISVQWLAQYVRGNRYAPAFMRESALDYANHTLRFGYVQCPGVVLDEDGWFYSDPNACDTL